MKIKDSLHVYEMDCLGDGNSQTTITVYVNALKLFTQYIGADTEVSTIDERAVRNFFIFLRTQYVPANSDIPGRLSTASVHRYWKALRSFFKWAKREIKMEPPDKDISMPAWENKEIDPYTQDEVKRLLIASERSIPVCKMSAKAYSWELPDQIRNRAIILLLLDTGLRPGELCRLMVEDLSLAEGKLFIKPYQPGKTLSGFVYFQDRTKRAIQDYLDTPRVINPKSPIFVTSDTETSLQPNTLQKMFSRLGRKAKVERCNTYRFRHTFAIEYLRNGGDVFSLQALMRHKRISTTRKYVKFIGQDYERIHRFASPVSNWKL